MHIIDINLIGVMYSLKLAIHFFRRSPLDDPQRDRCFIFGGSVAGYVDNLVRFRPPFLCSILCGMSELTRTARAMQSSWEYSTSKFGLRGLMRTVRRQGHHQGMRVAYIAPSYVARPHLGLCRKKHPDLTFFFLVCALTDMFARSFNRPRLTKPSGPKVSTLPPWRVVWLPS